MNLLIALFLIISEAVYEGLHDRGIKTIAGIIEFIYLIVVIFAVFAVFNGFILLNPDTCLWRVLIGYVFMRFVFFDIIYGLIMCKGWLFFGTTKLYDRVMNKILEKAGKSIIWTLRFIAFVWGFFWLMGWENGIRI